jgi:CHAD domain-containing protein
MAFRLRKDEPVAKGVQRVAKKELRSAVNQLAAAEPTGEAIHEARKGIKKVRAIVQLFGKELGGEGDVKRLRHAGRLLSPLRDADAILTSVKKLCAGDPNRKVPDETCSAIARELDRYKTRVTNVAEHDHAAAAAAKDLEAARRSAKHWTVKKIGFSVLAAEIKRGYKKGRRAMEKARNRNRADAFHTWRKRVKSLWYALRLLERRVPALRRRLADLHRLEEWLGEHHNLVMVRTKVVSDRGLHQNQTARTRIRALAEGRQEQLRRKALTLGERVFQDTPMAFERHLRKMWQTRDNRQRPRQSSRSPRSNTLLLPPESRRARQVLDHAVARHQR